MEDDSTADTATISNGLGDAVVPVDDAHKGEHELHVQDVDDTNAISDGARLGQSGPKELCVPPPFVEKDDAGKLSAVLEWTSAIESRLGQRMQDMNVSFGLRLTALERSFDNVVAKQSEVVNASMQQWQADFSKQIECLRTDLEAQNATGCKSLSDVIQDKQVEALGKTRVELEGCIATEVAKLTQRLSAAEDCTRELKAAIPGDAAQHLDADSALSAALQKQAADLEAKIENSVAEAVSDIRSFEGARIKKLEDIVQNLDYERLSRAEKFAKDLEEAHKKMTTQIEANSEIEHVSYDGCTKLEVLHEDILQSLSSEIVDVQAKLVVSEERARSLAASVSGAESRLSEQQDSAATQSGASTMAASSTEADDALMNKLKQSVAEATREHDLLVEKFDDLGTGLAVIRAFENTWKDLWRRMDNSIQKIVDERSGVVEQRHKHAVELALNQFEDSFGAKLAAQERLLSESIAKVGEIKDRILPDLQAEVDGAKTVSRDLAGLRELVHKRAREQETHETAEPAARASSAEAGSAEGARGNLPAMLEEWTSALEDKLGRKVQDINMSFDSRLTAMEWSLRDVISKQSEVVNVVVPQCQSDLNNDIKRLRLDWEAQSEKSSKALSESLHEKQGEVLGKTYTELEGRIVAEVAKLTQRLLVAEDCVQDLKAALPGTSAQLLESASTLRDALQKQESELEVKIESSTAKALSAIRSFEGARIQRLEDVVKSLDFERLSRSEKFSRDLEELNKKVAGREEANNEMVHILQRHSSELGDIQAKLVAANERASCLAASISGAETKLNKQQDWVASRLEAVSASSLASSKTEAKNALMSIRADEGVRLVKLEQSVVEATKEHDILVGKLDDLRTSLADIRTLAGIKLEAKDVPPLLKPLNADVESLIQKIQPLNADVESLIRKVQELEPSQAQHACHLERLEQQMREAHARLWPWRQSGGHTTELWRVGGGFTYNQEDGSAADGPHNRTAEENSGGSSKPSEMPQPPKKPPGRPMSAGVGRRPVGTGFTAARNWQSTNPSNAT
mmetsp:Transcript_75832/g.190778  ORF Transcript_75832/g.190778 Transcript_75832/m.190778 type:complete len:1031 (-) Transcript_75832:69-3161(-)|eukprot:CAMPEP_0115244212 /NCGR_PEP_ID=MMETSP0270-20121206/39873_1 /TAXON_ID=71861 /ORGANISM="Scrippsiella trochoidea, Strain CCMP3099" /LENGTH=1030 /DNA_ID=CAMNT_0002659345 /DNA_START=70 /DNA_END=3162 /DNA_ORIENTATION=+